MKTFVWTALSCAFLLCGCAKNEDPATPPPSGDTKKFAVRLDVSGFKQDVTDFGRADSLPDQVTHLYYIVYSQTDVVRKLEQTTGDEHFGTFLDSLPAGRYRIALLATEGPANLQDYHLSDLPRFLTYPSGDAFYKRIEIDVNGNVNQVVNLKRIVSRLKVVFTDIVPYDARNVEIMVAAYPLPAPDVFSPLMAALSLESGQLATPHPDYPWNYADVGRDFIAADKGMVNWSIQNTLLMLQSTTAAIQLTTFSNTGAILATKDIFNVRLEPGKTTVLTGKGFDNPGDGNGVSIIIDDPEWSEDSISMTF